MQLPAILANSIWVGAFPYSFKFFGLHVIVELPLEAFVIWLFIQKRERFVWLFGQVLLANVASFFVGTFALVGFSVPMLDLQRTAAAWLGAFVLSWAVECLLLRRWLQMIPTGQVIRATFWGNVASYTIAALIFIAYIRGIRMPWPMIR
ncbi:MAG: hypothetical protein ACKVY0_20995 [Prosthecobacter sp.]|uniref:hypothetical protein n=1 Tax=Prosthecobacter sp. TaxID=1965333 RepID=UPI003903F93D